MADNGQKSRWDYIGKLPEDMELPGGVSQPESSERNLLREADANPDLALAFIRQVTEDNPKMKSEMYLKICKFIALKAKGVQPLREREFYRVDVAGPGEIREYLKAGHLDWLELALNEISEIEKLDSEKESMQVLASDIDGVACIVDKCRPGRVQEILGWTKLWYFGLDRMGQMDWLKRSVPTDKKGQFIRTAFSFPRIVKSALACYFGTDERGREYMSFFLFPDFLSDWGSDDRVGDHEMGRVTIYDDGTYDVEEEPKEP